MCIKEYPAIERHLLVYKERLVPRPYGYKGRDWKGRKPGTYQWYEIQDTVDYYAAFEKPKILFPDLSPRGNFMLDESGGYYSVNTTYLLPTDDRYLLGLLNSRLMTSYYTSNYAVFRGGYLRFFEQYIRDLPIRPIDLSDPADRAAHDRMVQLVTAMLELHRRLAAAASEAERTVLDRQIAATDAEIDRLVYALYGLSDEEIAVVESGE